MHGWLEELKNRTRSQKHQNPIITTGELINLFLGIRNLIESVKEDNMEPMET